MTAFGNLLKQAREEKGYTQIELAKKFGWSTGQYISNIERGYVPFPKKSRKKLAHLLNMRIEEINNALVFDYKVKLSDQG